jgi:hypothetical protein
MKNKKSTILFFTLLCGVAVLTVVIIMSKKYTIIEGHGGGGRVYGHGGSFGHGHGHEGYIYGANFGGGSYEFNPLLYSYDDLDYDDDVIFYPVRPLLLY